MRVIAGTAKRLPLKTVKGMDTRPTTDRIKETLFNMIQNELYDIRFLDLFAGSGAIGIEALSRGARSAVFVENNFLAVQCIKENLSFTRLDGKGSLMNTDVMTALGKLEGEGPFQIVFMDPPYGQEWEKKILGYLRSSKVINGDTLLIVEADKGTGFAYLEEYGYNLLKRKEYKINAHIFIQRVKESRL